MKGTDWSKVEEEGVVELPVNPDNVNPFVASEKEEAAPSASNSYMYIDNINRLLKERKEKGRKILYQKGI